jgi:hypothetical protein
MVVPNAPEHRRPPADRRFPKALASGDRGVEGNARLTSATAVVLLVLLAAEGLTIVRIGPLLTPHVFIGMVLVPPIVLKVASTSYRFVKYYFGAIAYRSKGPPPLILRLLGPLLVLLTATVIVSGIVLLFVHHSLRSDVLLLHKVSFVLWFGAMTVHVLGHIVGTVRTAPRDFTARPIGRTVESIARQLTVVASVMLGLGLGFLVVGRVSRYLAG